MRSVEVTLNNQTKQLRYDFNALADLEEKFGKGIGVIFDEEQLGFRTLRLMYWAGLKWKEPGLKEQQVGSMLSEKMEEGETIQGLFEPVIQAMKLSGVLGTGEQERDESKN